MAIERTINIPAGAGAQTITIPGMGSQKIGRLEVAQIDNDGALYLALIAATASVNGDDVDVILDGADFAAFRCPEHAIRSRQTEFYGADWEISVVYPAGGNVQFKGYAGVEA